MSEASKTIIYVGIALATAVVAWASLPRPATIDVPDEIGTPIFPDFDDPLEAQRLEVVRFDDELGEIHRFEVANKNGLWVIPSHSEYPADAEDQMKDVASLLVDLEIIDVASDVADDHKFYGVVEPDREKLQASDEGVGLLVSMEDAKGRDLAALVIGAEVKDAENQRFVRRPGQDRVYIAEVDTEKLSTKFEDWIEKDLLKVNSWDIKQITLKDYSVNTVQTLQGIRKEYDPRLEVTANYDTDWELDEMLTFRDGKPVETELTDAEELNDEKLNDLKNALDEIEIVDVKRKPEGLGANLKADESFLDDNEALRSLVSHGFTPFRPPGSGSDGVEILATNGEVIARTEDGVEYLLRFGDIAGVGEGEDIGNVNRYLMVSAAVDKAKFPYPELESLPEFPEKPANKAGDESAPADDGLDKDAKDEQPVDESPGEKPETTSGEQDETEGAGEQEEEESEGPEPRQESEEDVSEEKPADKSPDEKPENTSDGQGESEESKSGEEAEAEPNKEPDPKDNEKGNEDEKPAEEPKDKEAESKPADEPDEDEIEAERQRITKENQRKIDEWNEKQKEAKEKVRDLNNRFADWYYVISEDIYKKIRLGRADLIKEKESAKDEGFGVDAFRKLEKEGIEKEE